MRYLGRAACALAAALVAPGCGIVTSAQSARAARTEQDEAIPRLLRRHGAIQIVIDGKPFLARGGELQNSSASSLAYMDANVWPKVVAMHFNTVLAPVYWQLIEPREGAFDFSTVDGLIRGARQHKVRLVLLWFGTWKNSMSSYVPSWMNRDQDRFPRAAQADGKTLDILSALSANNLNADASAFAALMGHLRAMDSAAQTVIMVQVENEVGMIPEARDHSAAADAAFNAPVPAALTDYLGEHKDRLTPELRKAWEDHGSKTGANWPETFGEGEQTGEFFTAWTEARYTGEVAARGKAVYPLPMYVNAALIRPGKQAGQYPSGGPLPHLFDIWRAAAPAIDFLAPDIYFPNFVEWAQKYALPNNPLFVPESGRAGAADLGADAFYAYAALNSMGFNVYAPEFLPPQQEKTLGDAYDGIDQLTPLILANQGTGKMAGIRTPVSFDGTANLAPQQFTLGDYTFDVHFKEPAPISTGAKTEAPMPGAHGGLIIQTGEDEYLVAGTGMIVTFGTRGKGIAGIDSIWEGRFVNGIWVRGRNLNGDDDNQGRYLRMPSGEFTIRRVRLYTYH